MQDQTIGQAVAARSARAALEALLYKVACKGGPRAPRRRRLNMESAHRRSLVGAKGLRP